MNGKLVAFALIVLGNSPCYALTLGLQGLNGQSAYEQHFLEDYERATAQLGEKRSLGPMLDLLQKYKRPLEQAQLEVTIGVAYGQYGGLIDPAKAAEHFSNALKFDLPEQAFIDVLMWRGNAYEQLNQPDRAMADYLRGLVACSYYALPGEWPEIKEPPQPIYMNSRDPENSARVRDYNTYRYKTDFVQHLMTQKYGFIESVRRVQQASKMDQASVLATLQKLTPDPHVIATVEGFLGEENHRPWP